MNQNDSAIRLWKAAFSPRIIFPNSGQAPHRHFNEKRYSIHRTLTYKLFFNASLSFSCPEMVLQCLKIKIEIGNATHLDIS